MLEKSQLLRFDCPNNCVDVEMGEFVLEEKSTFKMLGLCFASKLNLGSYVVSIAKTASRKSGVRFVLCNLFLWKLCTISINLLFSHAWNTSVRFGLML